jgi:hypothetical protein
MEEALELQTQEKKGYILLRVDAGFGTDENLNICLSVDARSLKGESDQKRNQFYYQTASIGSKNRPGGGPNGNKQR